MRDCVSDSYASSFIFIFPPSFPQSLISCVLLIWFLLLLHDDFNVAAFIIHIEPLIPEESQQGYIKLFCQIYRKA